MADDEKQAPVEEKASAVESIEPKEKSAEPKPEKGEEKAEGKTAKAEEKTAKAEEKTAAEGAEEKTEEAKPAVVRSRQKGGRHVTNGIVHITATFNNTQVSITDMRGNVISWSTAGRCGFKGSRKSTAFAATTVAQEAARAAASQGLREVEVRVQGPGAGRESAVRAVQAAGITVNAIKDVTPIPHNGCRPPKRRRV